ncbi:MAG: fumarylacetoacetate hydrolase family protein [Flavobacteriales bacterium]|nr:fumarylacetoacetate hydrolase family protein [Flavobacteriales bacterium]MCB9196214.1 fumarylacetoacetate hydrolase family protein [Flavobacteriales bacterium]
MKIICIGRNYSDHAKELNNDVPSEPVFFFKPDTAILPKKQPFYIPEFTKDLHHELEIVVRINKLGKNIKEKFAHTYYDEIGLGIDFTARDLQKECKDKGLPWEKAKGFDYSAPIGEEFIKVNEIENLNDLNFSLYKNGERVQIGNTKDMLFSIDRIIEYVSQFVTLKIGDLIFSGTPAGVGKVEIGDLLEGYIEDRKLLSLKVK